MSAYDHKADITSAIWYGHCQFGGSNCAEKRTRSRRRSGRCRSQRGHRSKARALEATLGLIAQHRDKLGAIVGLGAQRLVRDDDRRSRQCGRPDAIDHILRDGDAVERVLALSASSIVTAVQRRPASLRAIAVNTCVPIRFSALRIVTGTSMLKSNTSPPSGHGLCVLRRT